MWIQAPLPASHRAGADAGPAAMTERDAIETEVKALVGEAIGSLETVAHDLSSLDRRSVKDALADALLRIQRAQLLADRLS
jgi:hypothetical protein